MNDNIVRLEKVTIKNFKNVVFGEISLVSVEEKYKSSILGLYGQNGSGKTALIDSIALLKCALCGQKIPLLFADFINVDSESSELAYNFKIIKKDPSCSYNVSYSFKIKKDIDETESNTDSVKTKPDKYKVRLYDEILLSDYISPSKTKRKAEVINTITDAIFVPKVKYDLLIGKDKDTYTDLAAAKKITASTSRSFIFSKELLTAIRKKQDNNPEQNIYKPILDSLVDYGNYELFVINTKNTGLISLNALPLSFKYEKENIGAIGSLMISLNEPAELPKDAVRVVKNVIENMNIVLEQLIPGLTIDVANLGGAINQNNIPTAIIQLISKKNKKKIPLKYESEGIKKIVSILNLLIAIYNQESVTVAIDELDAGIFEYLLGELLRIVAEKGKGQLIFTSHNLRPLETLDRQLIAFTTTDPKDRYARMINVKKNNNLRDFYYRDITLGEQEKELYDATNNFEIALAFKEAGGMIGS